MAVEAAVSVHKPAGMEDLLRMQCPRFCSLCGISVCFKRPNMDG